MYLSIKENTEFYSQFFGDLSDPIRAAYIHALYERIAAYDNVDLLPFESLIAAFDCNDSFRKNALLEDPDVINSTMELMWGFELYGEERVNIYIGNCFSSRGWLKRELPSRSTDVLTHSLSTAIHMPLTADCKKFIDIVGAWNNYTGHIIKYRAGGFSTRPLNNIIHVFKEIADILGSLEIDVRYNTEPVRQSVDILKSIALSVASYAEASLSKIITPAATAQPCPVWVFEYATTMPSSEVLYVLMAVETSAPELKIMQAYADVLQAQTYDEFMSANNRLREVCKRGFNAAPQLLTDPRLLASSWKTYLHDIKTSPTAAKYTSKFM